MARSGYFPVSELATSRKIDSRLQGHPTTHEGLPGVSVASGSLGQGLPVSIGAAEAIKLHNDDHIVYSLLGESISRVLSQNYSTPQEFVATNDTFGESGTPPQLMRINSLDSKAIFAAAEKVL